MGTFKKKLFSPAFSPEYLKNTFCSYDQNTYKTTSNYLKNLKKN